MRSAISDGKRPFCVFEPPLEGLGTTYDVHIRLLRMHAVDFPLVLSELFSQCVTAEALRENVGSNFKIVDFAPTGPCWFKISSRRGRLPPAILFL